LLKISALSGSASGGNPSTRRKGNPEQAPFCGARRSPPALSEVEGKGGYFMKPDEISGLKRIKINASLVAEWSRNSPWCPHFLLSKLKIMHCIKDKVANIIPSAAPSLARPIKPPSYFQAAIQNNYGIHN